MLIPDCQAFTLAALNNGVSPTSATTTVRPAASTSASGTVQDGSVSEHSKFVRDAILDGARVLLSWPVVVLVTLVVFRGSLRSVIDALVSRLRSAPKIKVGSVYEDEGYRAVAAVVEKEIIEAKAPPTTTTTTTTTTAPPEVPFESRRQTIIRVAAEKATEHFAQWSAVQQFQGRRFPDVRSRLLTWVAEVGAPVVFRSYEVFQLVHQTASSDPVPSREYFENMVRSFDRDHPGQVG